MNPITFNFTGAVQTYNVTVTGTYTITAIGAGGGSSSAGGNTAGGLGAEIGGTFNLTAGQTLNIIVGGQGGSLATGGGGGFSEVYTGTGNAITPLLIAGGGGGGSYQGNGNTGSPGLNATAGTALGGANNGQGGASPSGGGGAGAFSNGNSSDGMGGRDAANGAAGGASMNISPRGGAGGFGGGGQGGEGGGAGGGGGGGYTGGSGGQTSPNGLANPASGGGGGTSYINTANGGTQTLAVGGFRGGNGNVFITAPATPVTPTPTPTPTPVTPTPTPTQPAVCYVTGTRIRVLRGRTIGDVPVERLRVGDLAITASGKPRPIRWIGHRLTRGQGHPRPETVHPVRIRAHALAPNKPARDLWLSPGHAIAIDATGTPEAEHGAVLAPAEAFINGATIVQVPVAAVTYWHVELDSHDLLIAEGVAAESYLDMGNRAFFGDGPVVALHATPDADPAARTHAAFCRPYRNGGAAVDAERARIHAQALAAAWTLERDLWAGAHLVVDGRRVPAEVEGEIARFRLPASARAVWLVSSASVPLHVGYAPDARPLGLAVTGLRIDGRLGAVREIALDDPLLGQGFYGVDGSAGDAWRWTAGRARLPSLLWSGMDGAVTLTVSVRDIGLPSWRAPEATVSLAG